MVKFKFKNGQIFSSCQEIQHENINIEFDIAEKWNSLQKWGNAVSIIHKTNIILLDG